MDSDLDPHQLSHRHARSCPRPADRIAVTWPRPVPTIGDRTSASQRSRDPSGWAFDDATVAAVQSVISARRDIRRYRPDPLDPQLIRQVLRAGHQAPSVGQSQPWRFIVVTQQDSRDRAARLADRERLRQAAHLTDERRSRLLDLQLDGIREAPVGIVVACDRRSPAAGVLGRATFTDADLWSCACAIENMWLAARAVGLGMGWVTLFDPDDLAELLGLPPGVETLGWLCLGWPDERPPEPGLERAGWSRRQPLDDVVMAERWPQEGEPPPPPSHLADSTALSGPAQRAVVSARDAGDRLLTAPGSLGILDVTINRVLALGRGDLTGGTLLVIAADHPVTQHEISAYRPSVTEDVLAATQRGESMGATTARHAGLEVRAIRAMARDVQGDLVTADALSVADVVALIGYGRSLGEQAAAAGLVCLGEVGVGNTTVAAALACALLGLEPEDAIGLGTGADTEMIDRKRAVVTSALRRAAGTYGSGLDEPVTMLAALGGPEFAMLAGITLGASAAGSPVVLDGLATSVAALIAVRMQPAVQAHLVAGQRSRERAHGAVLTDIGLEPLLDLRLRSGEGVGACLGAQLLLTGLALRRTAGRVSF
jgi:nicotinate-nucleotide--dimethylbenzimidazole phosphoribosyltransferase